MTSIGRVAIITPRYAPAIGGVERVAEMQARGLSRRGVQVEVLTTDPSRRLPPLEHRDGVLVRRFPTVANDSVYFVAPRLSAWLGRHAAEFDLLHAHSYHTPLALQSAVASRSTGVPLVVTPHYHGSGHTPLRRLLHAPYSPFGTWMLRCAARVLCVSVVEEQLLRARFGCALPTRVVPNGIDVDELTLARVMGESAPHTRARTLSVLSVGRLDKYKGAERLLRAVPHLPEGSTMTLIGDGPQRAHLARVAARLGVDMRVRLLGSVSRAELLAQYRAADVFASLSEHEAFGLAVLEAAAAGLPVMASDIPAHREVAGYLAPGRAYFVDRQASPGAVAAAVRAAAELGRAHDVTTWPLPTWADHVEGTAECYAEALAAWSGRR